MKKLLFLIPIIATAMLITACGSSSGSANNNGKNTPAPDQEENSSPPDLIGYVTDKDDDSILVISPESKDFSASGGKSEFYNAVWVGSEDAKHVEVGELVEVWFESQQLLESYPAQGAAKAVSAIDVEHPEGAAITEAEAIRRAIERVEQIDEGTIMIIKDVSYDKKTSNWDIEINEGYIQIGAANSKRPPKLTVSTEETTLEAKLGTNSWSYEDENGASTNVVSDSIAPPEMLRGHTPIQVVPNQEVELQFEHDPLHYEVRIWESETTIPTTNHKFEVPDQDGSFIYEVLAEWEQGTASYYFR